MLQKNLGPIRKAVCNHHNMIGHSSTSENSNDRVPLLPNELFEPIFGDLMVETSVFVFIVEDVDVNEEMFKEIVEV